MGTGVFIRGYKVSPLGPWAAFPGGAKQLPGSEWGPTGKEEEWVEAVSEASVAQSE